MDYCALHRRPTVHYITVLITLLSVSLPTPTYKSNVTISIRNKTVENRVKSVSGISHSSVCVAKFKMCWNLDYNFIPSIKAMELFKSVSIGSTH